MRNQFQILMLAALMIFAGAGCQTKLAPEGVYQGDTILFNAHRTILGAYDTLDTFVEWEYTNRAALAGQPEITKAADTIRRNAKTYLRSASNLAEAYASSPTPENRRSLENAISVLRQVLAEATAYMAARQRPPAQ